MPTTHRQIEPLCTPQSVDLVCVPRATVHKVWPKVCDLIYVAMKRGAVSSFKPVHDSVLAGAALLWLAWDGSKVHAAAVTELHKTEWRKVCVIVGCGGTDMKLWLHLLDGIEAFARAEGCDAMRIIGRKGWARVLKDYRVTRVILEKELD